MLVIADAAAPIAVAGVMGGADSEVGPATRTIVFESASFNANSVRRTSKALGLKTEASTRFERGVDPNLPLVAMQRACALLEATGAGRARGQVVDAYAARRRAAAAAAPPRPAGGPARRDRARRRRRAHPRLARVRTGRRRRRLDR